MELILKPSDFSHLSAISSYNNNYYKHKKIGYVIFEKCNEEYNFYEFYLVENDHNIFMGGSSKGFNDTIISMEFKQQWT